MDPSRRLAVASRRVAVARHRAALSRRRAAVAFAAFEASAAATDDRVRDKVVATAAAADEAAYAAEEAAYAAYFNPAAAAAYAAAAAAYAAVAVAYAAGNPVGDPAAAVVDGDNPAAADSINNAPQTPPPLIPSTTPYRSVNNPADPSTTLPPTDSVDNPSRRH